MYEMRDAGKFRDCGSPLPEHSKVKDFVQICRRMIFPGYYGGCEDDADRMVGLLASQVALSLPKEMPAAEQARRCGDVAEAFSAMLPRLRELLVSDVEATYNGDPAAVSCEEVVLCYPGIYAITNHRIAHALYNLGVPLIPRMISEQAHSLTGIDIHPGATVGAEFMIDHGTGVVIGATAIIGRHVKIYQGVTLGARSFVVGDDGHPVKGIARHPIVGNDVVIYANSTVLGRVTIGDGAIIGGNLWVTRDVQPGERLIQAKPEQQFISLKPKE